MARPAKATVSKQTLDFERSLVLNRYFLAQLPVPVAWFPRRPGPSRRLESGSRLLCGFGSVDSRGTEAAKGQGHKTPDPAPKEPVLGGSTFWIKDL